MSASSLASTARDLLGDLAKGSDPGSTIQDVHDALGTISQRGAGLLHFVETYRKLTRLPKPSLEPVLLADLFSRVRQLMVSELETRSISLTVSVAPVAKSLTADGALVEQAVINLVRNAIEAIDPADSGKIELISEVDGTCVRPIF